MLFGLLSLTAGSGDADASAIKDIYGKNKSLVVFDDDKLKTGEILENITQEDLRAARLIAVKKRLVKIYIRDKEVWVRSSRLKMDLPELGPCPKSVVSKGEGHTTPATYGVSAECPVNTQ